MVTGKGRCEGCGQPKAERWVVQEPVYYKANGWIGDQWVPHEKRVRTYRDRVAHLCEDCWQMKYNPGSREAREAEARELRRIKGVVEGKNKRQSLTMRQVRAIWG